MKHYRLQLSHGGDWTVSWFLTKEPAIEAARAADDTRTLTGIHIDLVSVLPGKAGLNWALNHAQVNRENWPGEPIQWRPNAQRKTT